MERPRGVRSVPRPARPAGPSRAQRPGGFKRYGIHKAPVSLGGPGVPPKWFLTGNVSAEEWPIYWACLAIYGEGPGAQWTFQSRIAPNAPGGVKPDFVLRQVPAVVMRVQAERYHVAVETWKAAYDIQQRLVLEQIGFVVVDLFPQHYIIDKTDEGGYGYLTGQAAILAVRNAQQHRQRMNPRGTGTNFARV